MAFDLERAFEVDENGIIYRDDDGNVLFYLVRGSGSPLGQQAPVPTVFINENCDIWRKVGPTVNDWVQVDSGSLYVGGVSANYNHIAPQCVGGGDASGN